jgi:cobalt-precorrin 5A hydrolase/precorrin-3B C17-methyltransferase
LVYHPKTLVIGIDGKISQESEKASALIERLLINHNLSSEAIAGIFVLNTEANHAGINSIAQSFNIPVRLFDVNELNINKNIAEALALKAVGKTGKLVTSDCAIAIASTPLPIDVNNIGQARGKLAIVGTGPGSENWMSKEVREVLQTSTDWVGYKTYLNLVEPLRKNQQRHESDNRVEIERAKSALELAATGRTVAVVSSGDPGIFAMATAVFEVL